MEDSYLLESMDKIQRVMYAIQGNFSYMLSIKDHLYDIFHILHRVSLKDDEEIFNLNDELMATQYYLRITQISLFEFNIEIEKLHQEFQRSHIPSYTFVLPSHMDDCIPR